MDIFSFRCQNIAPYIEEIFMGYARINRRLISWSNAYEMH